MMMQSTDVGHQATTASTTPAPPQESEVALSHLHFGMHKSLCVVSQGNLLTFGDIFHDTDMCNPTTLLSVRRRHRS